MSVILYELWRTWLNHRDKITHYRDIASAQAAKDYIQVKLNRKALAAYGEEHIEVKLEIVRVEK